MLVSWNEVVERAMTTRPALVLPRNFKLPCLPQSVVEFTAVANDPEAGPKKLAAPIEADSTLTSGLLRQVNSTAVGLRQPVMSVVHAVNLLGARRTKTLVLAAALQAAVANTSSRLINMTQFQSDNRMRSLFAANAAKEIGADHEVAQLAGLLQDFMLPFLTEAFYSDYVQFLHQGKELIEEEQRRFGWNHATIAAGLMYDWGFPSELIAGVLLHHQKSIVSEKSLRESFVGASLVAASLPDSLGQSPDGFSTLLEMQAELSEFCFLSIAADVDEELNGGDGKQEGLCDRLLKLTEQNLEQRKLDRIQQHRQLGNYVLQEKVGQGAMGVIYRAQHCMLKRPAAIKILNSKIGKSSIGQFEAEVQLTCQLSSPNTVSVYDFGVTPEGLFYYAMEFLDGVTLDQLVRHNGPMTAGRVIHMLKQAASSLAEAHGLGLIHRDLKPENMMVCTRGGIPDTIKVLDFGLATMISENSIQEADAATLRGTPYYMSPESISQPQSVDARSDLYSLGAVGYFLLTGKTVFDAPSVMAVLNCHLNEIPQRPSARIGRSLDRDLEDVLLKCLAKSREDRPASAVEFAQLLGQCQAAGRWTPMESTLASIARKIDQESISDCLADTHLEIVA